MFNFDDAFKKLLVINYYVIYTKWYREDLNYYFVEYAKGWDQMHTGYALGSKWLTQAPGIRQAMSYLSWSAIYW